ncbi:MAG TPA: ElyC/SanA/YdcF family protein [Chthonomonadaceae bacterium]|nr:ElyC/SanA/YdcF family protein [Chthonomonadaceae bacterium]
MTTNQEPPRTETAPPPRRLNDRWRLAGEGVVLGLLSGMLAMQLGIGGLTPVDLFLIPAALGALIALTRARLCLWIVMGMLLFGTILVGYTPLVDPLMRGLTRSDPLHPCDAVVILSSMTHKDGSLSAHANDRALQGYRLLRQGYSQHLVMSDATVRYGSQIPEMQRQMAMLGLDYPIESVGPAGDTHDEALGVAQLVRRHGWKQVILVTHSWHMRRAAAVFEKAGVSVLCSPCVEGEYDLSALNTPPGRWRAFRDWLHEVVGYQIYRLRGWI